MKKNRKVNIILVCLGIFLLLVFAYRYSAKRIQYFGHYDKVWAHRVNDLKKLESSQSQFNGIELDLMYQKEANYLAVNHPPAPISGLTFQKYLSNITQPNIGIWLDIKNLNPNNVLAVFNLIEKAVKNSTIKRENIIVESSKPQLLNQFKEKSYRISYYLPTKLHQMGTKKLEVKISKIKEKIKTSNQLEISSNFEDYLILKKYFPKTDKNIWVMHSTYSFKIIQNYKQIRTMLKDPTVKTVLTPYNNFNQYF